MTDFEIQRCGAHLLREEEIERLNTVQKITLTELESAREVIRVLTAEVGTLRAHAAQCLWLQKQQQRRQHD